MTAAAPLAMPLRSSKEFEMIYNMVRTDGIFMLKHNDLELQHNLGKGNFGSVIRGTYRLRGKVIDVAVKVLKANDMAAEVRVDFFAGWKTWKCQGKILLGKSVHCLLASSLGLHRCLIGCFSFILPFCLSSHFCEHFAVTFIVYWWP